MILGAALLVLVALGLFVAGIATGTTALYWACVAVSAFAAVLLVLARRQVARPAGRAPVTERVAARAVDDEEARHPQQDDVAAGTSTARTADTRSGTDGTAGEPPAEPMVDGEDDEPPAEEVEVTDLLLVMDIHDEVVVVDEHPRYHLADCAWLGSRTAIPVPIGLPVDEARTDGFTPCGLCAPDRHLAAVERDRRARRGAS